ncbi:MAG TPA: 16S rRNA (guanine(966)-N(2))-methyltransferase RsmD [Thermodesulfobacteriota bacterium]
MRITGGEWRGRRLAAPRGEATRPSTDRLRAAVFNILEARGAPIRGAAVLDLFAGTGSLGLEALSRGAARATFVEGSGRAVAVLARNVASLGVPDDRVRIVRADVEASLDRLAREGAAFGTVFLDPPYGAGLAAGIVARLADLGLVAPGGFVVAEHATGEAMPAAAGDLVEAVRRAYGRTAITVYRRSA